MRTLISAKHVTKIYENGEQKKNVIDDVSLTVEEGEFIAIMGPSGAGKSTLLYALSGMEPIDEGSITFDGVELARCSEKKLTDIRRKKMGFVFQRPTLLKNLNLLDNIIFPALDDAKDRKTKKEIVERGRELMRRTGILELEHRSMDKASGGQLQRVGICRALMNHPDILLGMNQPVHWIPNQPKKSWSCSRKLTARGQQLFWLHTMRRSRKEPKKSSM